eukprot:2444589-Pleurochrysis_carterae.AAC.1
MLSVRTSVRVDGRCRGYQTRVSGYPGSVHKHWVGIQPKHPIPRESPEHPIPSARTYTPDS